MKGFAKRFNSLRLEGETQKEFADRLGLTQASISRYLSGHNPDRESLRRISTRTGVSVDWMLTGKDADQPGKDKKSDKPLTDKELVETGLTFIDKVKNIAPPERQTLRLMVKDLAENSERLKATIEFWNGLRLQGKPPRKGRRPSTISED